MDALVEGSSPSVFLGASIEVTFVKASIDSYVDVRNVSIKVNSMKAFVEALVKDCVNVVFTEVSEKVSSKEAFVKVTLSRNLSWNLLPCNSPRKLPWKRS